MNVRYHCIYQPLPTWNAKTVHLLKLAAKRTPFSRLGEHIRFTPAAKSVEIIYSLMVTNDMSETCFLLLPSTWVFDNRFLIECEITAAVPLFLFIKKKIESRPPKRETEKFTTFWGLHLLKFSQVHLLSLTHFEVTHLFPSSWSFYQCNNMQLLPSGYSITMYFVWNFSLLSPFEFRNITRLWHPNTE